MEKSLYANLGKVKHFEISKASSNKLERKPTEYNIKKPNGKVFLEVVVKLLKAHLTSHSRMSGSR